MTLRFEDKLRGQRAIALAHPCTNAAERADTRYSFTVNQSPGAHCTCVLTVERGPLGDEFLNGRAQWRLSIDVNGHREKDWTRVEHRAATRVMERVLLGIGMPGDDRIEGRDCARIVRRVCTPRERATMADEPYLTPGDIAPCQPRKSGARLG
jgi:hypothetical protein